VILLVDAHVLIWWLAGDQDNLSDEARSALANPANGVVVSAATLWELAIKRAQGRIEVPGELSHAVTDSGFSSVPVTSADGERAAGLPPHHRDPFDRMLVAQALRLGAVVVARDSATSTYDVEVLTA
jgi:PIN domain nuclease of toxin-antitoxin system